MSEKNLTSSINRPFAGVPTHRCSAKTIALPWLLSCWNIKQLNESLCGRKMIELRDVLQTKETRIPPRPPGHRHRKSTHGLLMSCR